MDKYRAIQDEAKQCQSLRQEIVNNGFMSCAPARQLRAESKRTKYLALEPQLLLTKANDLAAAVVELATLPSAAVPEEIRPRWPLKIAAEQISCTCWVAIQPLDESN